MGLGEGEGGDGASVGDGGQVAFLLLVGAAEGDGEAAEALHDEVGVGLSADLGQFLPDDAEVGNGYSVAAVLGGDGVAEEFCIGEDAHQLRGDAAGLIHVGGDGGDFFLGEGADLAAQIFLLGG